MKKMYLMILFYLLVSTGVSNVEAKHFNYDEAWQITNGVWYEPETGMNVTPVWKSRNGVECNIVNNKGYTDAKGNSKIYFDYKGIPAYMDITYYANEDRYYANFSILNVNAGKWHVIKEDLMKY